MSYSPYRPDERWEYEMFTEVLSSRRYPEKQKFALIQPGDQLSMRKVHDYDRQLARLIDKAVRILLQRAGDQGWEPVDAVDAESLWTKGRVRFRDMADAKDSADGSRMVELTTLHIFCRRRIQLRSNAVASSVTEPNPALKHLESDDDKLLA